MKFQNNHRLILLFMGLLIYTSCTNRSPDYGPDIYVPDTTFKIVGYLATGNFDRLDSLELNKLTYLNLAFGNPDKEGNLIADGNADISPVVQRGHDLNLKVFISLAGGGRPDTVIWKSLLLPKNRSAFVKKIVTYVEANNLDGVDVDIEGNLLPYIGVTYNPFVVELKNALHAKGKGITAALGAVDFHEAVHQEALEAYDFINVMVYDKTGVWRPDDIGPHSPWSYAIDAIKFWTEEKKIPAKRITLGVPFYGFDFTPPARYISYSEIIKENPGYAYQDSVGRKFYYNGIPMIAKKTQLAKEYLGGVMIWELAYDVTGDLSLLRALSQTIAAGNCPVSTFFRDSDRDGFGDMTKPVQACTAPEGYVSNMDDPDDNNARSHPVVK
jgi:spore germination protein YaaH